MCYKTGHFYLLLTSFPNFLDRPCRRLYFSPTVSGKESGIRQLRIGNRPGGVNVRADAR